MSQFHPRSCLFVYDSLIITTAKNILVLNEQAEKPSFLISLQPIFKTRQPPQMLCSHLTYFPVQKERLLERKVRYCCCLPSPCSNLLFVNAALTPEPSGAQGIPPTSGCNTCSVWERCSQLSSKTFGQASSAVTAAKRR